MNNNATETAINEIRSMIENDDSVNYDSLRKALADRSFSYTGYGEAEGEDRVKTAVTKAFGRLPEEACGGIMGIKHVVLYLSGDIMLKDQDAVFGCMEMFTDDDAYYHIFYSPKETGENRVTAVVLGF